MKKHALILLSFALVVPPAAVVTAAPTLAAAGICWTVVDSSDGSDGPDMETLCIDANLKASFGAPSTYFGDVSKCGTVVVGSEAKKNFTVNLSGCAGNLPNHRIVCQPMQSGQAHCVLSWADGSEDRQVLLVPASD